MTFNWRLEKGLRYLETGRPDLMEFRTAMNGVDCKVWYEPPTEGGWRWSVGIDDDEDVEDFRGTADSKEEAMRAATREAGRW